MRFQRLNVCPLPAAHEDCFAAYRGLLRVGKGAKRSKAFVRCDALLLDEKSRSDTYPSIEIDEERVDIGHDLENLEGWCRRPPRRPDGCREK